MLCGGTSLLTPNLSPNGFLMRDVSAPFNFFCSFAPYTRIARFRALRWTFVCKGKGVSLTIVAGATLASLMAVVGSLEWLWTSAKVPRAVLTSTKGSFTLFPIHFRPVHLNNNDAVALWE